MKAFMSKPHDGLCFSGFAGGVWCERERQAWENAETRATLAEREARAILAESEHCDADRFTGVVPLYSRHANIGAGLTVLSEDGEALAEAIRAALESGAFDAR